jgi:hypothetical protein
MLADIRTFLNAEAPPVQWHRLFFAAVPENVDRTPLGCEVSWQTTQIGTRCTLEVQHHQALFASVWICHFLLSWTLPTMCCQPC